MLQVCTRGTGNELRRSARGAFGRAVTAGAVLAAALSAGSAAQAQCVTNSQTIFATLTAPPGGCIENYGTITSISPRGAAYGILINGAGSVTNSGTTTASANGASGVGGVAQAIFIGTNGSVTNSGLVSATSTGSAQAISIGGISTLTLLPGSWIVGSINFGIPSAVNFRVGNQNLTFDLLTGATVTSTVPFVVSGNRVVAIDPAREATR